MDLYNNVLRYGTMLRTLKEYIFPLNSPKGYSSPFVGLLEVFFMDNNG